MKVDNNAPIRPSAARSGRSAGSGTARFSADLGEKAHAPGVSGGAPIGGASAMMALQEMADHGESRRKAARRGGQLLDLLDELRADLLSGGISAGTLHDLSRVVGEARANVDSQGLQQILDEIDLRVQVELAKYEAAL